MECMTTSLATTDAADVFSPLDGKTLTDLCFGEDQELLLEALDAAAAAAWVPVDVVGWGAIESIAPPF